MGQGIDALRAQNRSDVLMPSGLTFTLRLPRIPDLIQAGSIPLPVLQHLEDRAKAASAHVQGDGPAPEPMSREDIENTIRFNDEVVMATVVAINGDPVELTRDDLRDMTEEDFQEVVLYGMRTKPLPGKG